MDDICIEEDDFPDRIFRELKKLSEESDNGFLIFDKTSKGLLKKEVCGDKEDFINFITDRRLKSMENLVNNDDFERAFLDIQGISVILDELIAHKNR